MNANGTRLARRETEVLKLLAKGIPRERIAAALEISPHTVRNHIESMMNKLNMKSQIQLVAYAYRKRIVPIPRMAKALACPNCGTRLVIQLAEVDHADSIAPTG